MSITGIFIFLVFLVLIIGAGILFFNSAKKGDFIDGIPATVTTPAQQQANMAYNAYLPQPVWGAFTPNITSDGNCLAYTASSGQFFPTAATYQNLNLGSGRGFVAYNQNCLDADQIFAQAGSHECLFNNAGAAGTSCILSVPTIIDNVLKFPGEKVSRGVVEGVYNGATGTTPYYASCNYVDNAASNTPSANPGNLCGGNIGIISPNFTPIGNPQQPESFCNGLTNTQNYCIALDSDIPFKNQRHFNLKLDYCDLGNFQQIFRVVRYSIDSNYNLNEDPTGSLAAIIFRENGYYLAPELTYDPIAKQYIFDSLIKNPVTSTLFGEDTINLILINPTFDTTRNGIYWLLQDQLANPEFDPTTVPAQQYFGCNVNPVSIANAIDNCGIDGVPTFYRPLPNSLGSNTYKVDIPISPQQFIYVPNVYQLPTTSVSDTSGYWTYLSNQFTINTIFKASDILSNNYTNPYLGLQAFRQSIKGIVFFVDCGLGNSNVCIANYTPALYPISADQGVYYPDAQFLEYTNLPNAITLGIGPITPGCQNLSLSQYFSGVTYNPIVPNNDTLIFTSANSNPDI